MMRQSIFTIAVLALFSAAAVAQAHKAGLYDITSTMEFKQAPFMQMPGASSPLSAPHSEQVCVSQAMIDKYNGVVQRPGGPGGRQQDCKMSNLNKTATGMTGQLVCTGHTNGKADIQMTWGDGNSYTGTMHFIGQMQMGAESRPFEYVVHISSTYKGADCGSVKPLDMPAN